MIELEHVIKELLKDGYTLDQIKEVLISLEEMQNECEVRGVNKELS